MGILMIFVKNFKLFVTLICLFIFIDLFILLTIAIEAPLLKDSLIKLLPSFFLPLIVKKTSFFFISLEFIFALRISTFKGKEFFPISSFKILILRFLDNF